MSFIRPAILKTWNNISADASELEDFGLMDAVELVLDANRLETFCPEFKDEIEKFRLMPMEEQDAIAKEILGRVI